MNKEKGRLMDKQTTPAGIEIKPTPLSGCTVGVEHEYLCFRNQTGWLLWSGKIADQPETGWDLENIMDYARIVVSLLNSIKEVRSGHGAFCPTCDRDNSVEKESTDDI